MPPFSPPAVVWPRLGLALQADSLHTSHLPPHQSPLTRPRCRIRTPSVRRKTPNDKTRGRVRTPRPSLLMVGDPTLIHYWRRFELTTASLTTWPRFTPCITAPAPVMMLGSFTPSPLQS